MGRKHRVAGDGTSTSVDIRSFDLTIEGSIIGKDGVQTRAVPFNAYTVIKNRYTAQGALPDEATIVHTAMEFMRNYRKVAQAVSERARPMIEETGAH